MLEEMSCSTNSHSDMGSVSFLLTNHNQLVRYRDSVHVVESSGIEIAQISANVKVSAASMFRHIPLPKQFSVRVICHFQGMGCYPGGVSFVFVFFPHFP